MPWIHSCEYVFLSFRILNNLRLPWKTEFALKFFTVLNIALHSGFLSNLCLPWKTECALNSLYWIYIFIIQNFEQPALALKNIIFPENFICIEIFVIFQDFWATRDFPENRVCPEFFKLIFLNSFGFFGKQKKPDKILLFLAFFQSERLVSGETLSELHNRYKSLLTRVYYHAGCTEYCKDFTVALKMIDVSDKKQMHDRLIRGKENASKDWSCIISMCLMSFNVYFVFGLYVSCVYALKLLFGFFWLFWGQGLAFCWCRDRLATLAPASPAVPFLCSSSTARIPQDISAASFCCC